RMKINESRARITDPRQRGTELWKQAVIRSKDQVVIDLKGFAAGNYQVSLKCGSKTISSSTLTVAK
ncbi:MAG: hypothetical protein WCR72_19415, partial [Bacteroidota bacterium]